MPDFGDTAFSGSLAPSVPIVQPVNNNAGAGLLNDIAGAIHDFTGFFAADQANQKTKANGALITEINRNVNALSDARDQGVSSSEIYTRLRAKQNEWMANNPGQEALIQDTVQKALGPNGLAQNISTQTPEEKAKADVLQKAETDGWALDPSMSVDDAVKMYSKHQQAAQAVTDISNEIALQTGQQRIVTAAMQSKATIALNTLIQTGLPWVQGNLDAATKQLAGVTDPAQRAQIIADTTNKINTQIALIDSTRAEAGNPVDTQYMTKDYTDLVKNFTDQANGKIDQDAADLQTAKIKSRIDNLIMMDPKTATAIELSHLTGLNGDPTIDTLLTQANTRIIAGLMKNADGTTVSSNQNLGPDTPSVVGQSDDIKQTFGYLKGQFTSLSADPTKSDPNVIKEANNVFTNMFKSVAANASSNPTDLSAFMTFMADPATGKYLEAHMKELPPEVQKAAIAIVQQNYQNVGVDLVNERWASAAITLNSRGNRGAGGEVDMIKAVHPTWDGSNISFDVDPKYKNDAQIQQIAKDMTKDVAGPLNNMVKAQAHMEGTTDYNSVYEKEFADRLWVAGQSLLPNAYGAKANDTDSITKDSRTDYYKAIAKQESGGDATAKNPNSSATGTYQFTTGTWAGVMRTHPELNLTADGRTDPTQEEKAIKAFTNDNADYLKKNNVDTSNANLYAAHFLGAPGAVDVLHSQGDTLISDIVSPRVISANHFLVGMTVDDFKKWIGKAIS